MSAARKTPKLEPLDPWRWRIPAFGAMRTDGLIYASRAQIDELRDGEALGQVVNVATLPGIVGPSIAMPDIHCGYGFPIGGVAAFDAGEGVVSPGGVGYDINCGVRLLKVPLDAGELQPKLRELAEDLFRAVPSGVGSARSDLALDDVTLDRVLADGCRWAVAEGYGSPADLEAIETGGRLADADPARVSSRARERGRRQLGTLGSGNHFVEVQRVDETFAPAAAALGLARGGVTVMIHTGSRGLGHQVCDDHLDLMLAAAGRYGIPLVDRQLCCAPLPSPEARAYLGAMNAAANFAFANRQLITHQVRSVLRRRFGAAVAEGTAIVYDVAHNIAKLEEHRVGGDLRRLCVHRKGATRAFPPGHPELAPAYRSIGQPVLVPGDMGTASFVLLGTDRAASETFSSCCHGAGRSLSRTAARRAARGRDLGREMAARGVVVRAASRATVAEEMPEAYKNVEEVAEVVHRAGIGLKLARLRPLAVIKG